MTEMTTDPYLWLEDVTGTDALEWVERHNADAAARLAGDAGFAATQQAILDVLDSDDRIPVVTERGGWYYNFWQDAQHVRGIWRRCRPDSYTQDDPEWDILLDLDELSQAEDTDWVWHGAQVRRTDYARALVELSRGGSDADQTREFDLATRQFVPDGFHRPESKGSAIWVDDDTLLVGTDFGPDTMSASGYPREVRRWRRGQPLQEATLVFRAAQDDTGAFAGHDATPGFERDLVERAINFYRSQFYLVRPAGQASHIPDAVTEPGADPAGALGADAVTELGAASAGTPGADAVTELGADPAGALGADAVTELGAASAGTPGSGPAVPAEVGTGTEPLVRIEVPESATVSLWRSWLLVSLREEWLGHRPGTLLATDLEDFLAGGRQFATLFEPTATTSLAALTCTSEHVVLTVLDNVASTLWALTPPAAGPGSATAGTASGPWRTEPLEGVPPLHTIAVGAVDSISSDEIWAETTGFLSPSTLLRGGVGEPLRAVKRAPAFFDPTGLEVTQHFAASDDGTRVPYFQVARADAPRDGSTPTLLYGYGGFEISRTPTYSGALGRVWLERGGAYVLANIRGGGEYGPAWHQAALQAKRHRAFEDFAAVARDLAARGLANAAHLGCMGGSNGGLLTGNMLVTYPELFGAIVIQVPLLDMKRYSHLLAGASWIAEYGDPDDPDQWEFLRTFSPYHLVEPGRTYPPVLLTTSTRDDRVHPGHARKMTALLEVNGADVTYYENTEGGHAGSSTNAQAAYMSALAFEFLWRHLA